MPPENFKDHMSLKSAYLRLVKSGALKQDSAQEQAVFALASYSNALKAAQGLFGFILRAPCGLYLYGPPGRGKSMMMDLFFKYAPVSLKRRVHFHAFMAEVHKYIHQWREGDKKARQDVFGQNKGDDPIVPLAALIAKKTKLLCFDEFQVSDIADAMILGRLFDALITKGVSFVITSNRYPDDLYKDGLNRERFLPFIAMIKKSFKMVELGGPRDFRQDRLLGARTYFSPTTDPSLRDAFYALWGELSALNEVRAAEIMVNERLLRFEQAAGPLLLANFKELCAVNNGPSDYLAIAERFTTVFIADVPILSPENRNEAKRFVTLIDALYEAHTLLVILAEAEPDALYPVGTGAFEFERTASRLQEMRSHDYISRPR